jgi:hypothetical protein
MIRAALGLTAPHQSAVRMATASAVSGSGVAAAPAGANYAPPR